MRVLVACEFTGTVREAFRSRGHSAVSCDLLPAADGSLYHIQDDVRNVIEDMDFDLMIAHPPCTYLCSSGLHWNKRVPGRAEKTEEALDFVRSLLFNPIKRVVIENPVGCISTRLRRPDQIIQPFQFGHDASKQTCLWLRGVPLLRIPLGKYVEPRMVGGKRRWGNQTDSGQNRLGPSESRWALRSATYSGIADAMAEQWGSLND